MAHPDRYAVIGNPIEHSKSPQIHSRFAQQTGQVLSYEPLLAPRDGFVAAIDAFQNEGGKGLNITVPFKQEAWALADELSDRARMAGAVNTLSLNADGHRRGDNTDGVGLVRDLTVNHGIELAHKRILILGAGGAVRGVLAPLLSERPTEVVIANRTVFRAEELANRFGEQGRIRGCGFADLTKDSFDIVINGTSASLQGELPPLPAGVVGEGSSCYDMMYAAVATPFMRWARELGAEAFDGLGMLVEQAAESFTLWRGVRPETAAVIIALRNELNNK